MSSRKSLVTPSFYIIIFVYFNNKYIFCYFIWSKDLTHDKKSGVIISKKVYIKSDNFPRPSSVNGPEKCINFSMRIFIKSSKGIWPADEITKE